MTGSRKRRLAIAMGIYLVVSGVYFALTPKNRLMEHTQFNHFALLAESWKNGRLDLPHGPPGYAANNDFASFHGKWYVAFPPFPAVLLLPLVLIGKTADNVRDGQFFLWLAGIGPAVLFLVLEQLRRDGRSPRNEKANVALALLLAFGTVYFFTSLQGTVWFAAHVVAVGIGAIYLLCSLDAAHPVLAGTMIGVGFLTRTPLLFATPFFLFEAARVSMRRAAATDATAVTAPDDRLHDTRTWRLADVDARRLVRLLVQFAVPVALLIGAALVYNRARFGTFLDFGYEYLTVAWQGRMRRWGLFNYHFLARNLGVVLTSLPWHEPGAATAFQINEHGLALWVTTPLYLWLVWPKEKSPLAIALYVTAAAVAIPGLFYQNTGWMQFGYRFSNDYAPFLFVLLAVTGHKFGKRFAAAALVSVVVNAFGAATFDHGDFRRFYYEDPSQKVLYQPD